MKKIYQVNEKYVCTLYVHSDIGVGTGGALGACAPPTLHC